MVRVESIVCIVRDLCLRLRRNRTIFRSRNEGVGTSTDLSVVRRKLICFFSHSLVIFYGLSTWRI